MLNSDSAEKTELVEVVKKRSLPAGAKQYPTREAVGKAKSPARIKQSSISKDKGDRRTLKRALKGVAIQRKLSSPSVRRLQLQFETHLGERAGDDEPIPLKTKKGTIRHEIETINAADLNLVPVDRPQPPVPALSYGLERVLFNPGVYHLQDPRSRVFNFDPYLQEIMPVSEFDFTLLKRFITSSRDKALLQVAAEQGSKYTGSTSSMTSALSHFHYLLSQWRPPNTGILSKDFPVEFRSFTQLQRGPSAIFLRYKDGIYAIDADKQFDTANVLSMLGQSMEKLLTLSTEDFEKYRKSSSETVSDEARNEPESYHYTTMGDFLMRSQLDAHDPRIPGTGMFDLKTRAVVSIRMDVSQYEEGSGYEIRGRHGQWESFEREYYDMIRAAFLKYSLQVRMGRMDGIFVAYHNTERIFGFQYISLPEMDYALHGTDNRKLGDEEFKLSLNLMNRVLDRATAKYPKQSLRLHFETRGKADEATYMYIFARPIREEVIEEIQNTNKAKVEEFEKSTENVSNEESNLSGSDSASNIEDREGSQPTTDAEHNEDSVEHLHTPPEDNNTTASETAQGANADDEANPSELMAMYLTIRNKVDGVYVRRPENLDENSDWKVEYALAEIDDKEKALTLYNALRKRRRQILVKTDKDKDNQWNNRYINSIKAYNARGREFRKHMKEIQAKEPLKVLYAEPLAEPAGPSTLKSKETWTEDRKKE
ncbi:mitochondrial protein Pet127-domain-containing protein [Tricladium varicosporioides]|nr:mitochondrial protein Pet127-domain-containing protein [Hymenoscyphus varicosporioides]